MSQSDRVVLAVDPGSSKCGLAVVSRASKVTDSQTGSGLVQHRAIVPSEQLGPTLADLVSRFSPDVILIGDGTTSARALAVARECNVPIEIVDEKLTSVLAKKRFFQENPPQGLRKLIPISLQTPPRAYDDYVAIILSERYLSKG